MTYTILVYVSLPVSFVRKIEILAEFGWCDFQNVRAWLLINLKFQHFAKNLFHNMVFVRGSLVYSFVPID